MGVTLPTAGTIVGTNDDCIANHGRTSPIVSAKGSLTPHQFTGSGIDADEVAVFGFTVPVAGIDIAVMISDGGVILTAHRIDEYPDGFQSLCIKGFNSATGLRAENQAIAIGGGNDIKTAIAIHLVCGQYFAGLQVSLCDRSLAHKDQRVIRNNHATGRIGPACAFGNNPFGHCGGSGNGCLGIGDSHVVEAVAEVRPVSGCVVRVFPRNKDFRISRGGIAVTQRPQIPATAGVQCNSGLARGICGYGLGVGVKECPAIKQCIFCCRSQSNRKGGIQLSCVLVGDFILVIHEITETCRRSTTIIPSGVTGKVHKITALQDNPVNGC